MSLRGLDLLAMAVSVSFISCLIASFPPLLALHMSTLIEQDEVPALSLSLACSSCHTRNGSFSPLAIVKKTSWKISPLSLFHLTKLDWPRKGRERKNWMEHSLRGGEIRKATHNGKRKKKEVNTTKLFPCRIIALRWVQALAFTIELHRW